MYVTEQKANIEKLKLGKAFRYRYWPDLFRIKEGLQYRKKTKENRSQINN